MLFSCVRGFKGIQHFHPKVVVISIGKNLYHRGKIPFFKKPGRFFIPKADF